MLKHLATALAALSLLSACQGPRAPPAPAAHVEGRWSEAALDDLLEAAAGAVEQGFREEGPAIDDIAMLREGARTNRQTRAMLDELADDVFMRLAQAYAQGAVDPARDPAWRIPRAAPAERDTLLAVRAAGGQASALLQSLLPADPQYLALAAALSQVRGEPQGAVDTTGLTRERRLASLRVSLERWRWLPRDMGERRIDVRVPHFEAVHRAPDGDRTHRVIVGARATQTPSFAAALEAITINPTWTVPRSIATNELLPRFARDPSAAARDNYEVLDSRGQIVDLAAVDWNRRPFPYTLRQRAGVGNALGRIKFEMPNPYDIYIHDTPSRGLFERDDRALSHGCIRIQEPLDLAGALLAPGWTTASVQGAIDEGTTFRIPIAEPLPVYVLYITAVADEDGVVRFADDVYRRDAAILAALDAPDAQFAASALQRTATECSP